MKAIHWWQACFVIKGVKNIVSTGENAGNLSIFSFLQQNTWTKTKMIGFVHVFVLEFMLLYEPYFVKRNVMNLRKTSTQVSLRGLLILMETICFKVVDP